MKKYLTILKKKRNVKQTPHKWAKITQHVPSPQVGDSCESFYVCYHLSNPSKVRMKSFRKKY